MNMKDIVGCNVYDEDDNIIGLVMEDEKGVFIQYDDGTLMRMNTTFICDENNSSLYRIN